MIVFIINNVRIFAFEGKSNAPVTTHPNRPDTFPFHLRPEYAANTEVTWRLHCKDLKSRMYGISVRYEGLTDGQCKREQI